MAHYTLRAQTLKGTFFDFGVDEVSAVFSSDGVFYIGDTPCAIESIECVELEALRAENDRLRAELSACIAGGNDYTGAILPMTKPATNPTFKTTKGQRHDETE